jgi:hypothetical protein
MELLEGCPAFSWSNLSGRAFASSRVLFKAAGVGGSVADGARDVVELG